ncbi:hypothetical protein Tco_0035712, partial [Tanacetum coccineum]
MILRHQKLLKVFQVLSGCRSVTDIAQKDKNEAKRIKLSTGIERVREIKAECIFILNRPT